jgi:hypothetical protein
MNPPFSDVRKHISAALSLMGRDGHAEPATLVALVPVDTFSTARVNTKIIRIRKD